MRAAMETKMRRVDVLVIGGGVVGCAILRELSRYDATVALLERNPDICEGTSKSNSAIVHTGFDAPPGSLEARLLAEARGLWPDIIESLHIPYLQTGALMVATSVEELATIESEIIPKAERNGVVLQRLAREEILEAAPYVNPPVTGCVLVEGEGVIDPFWTTRAYCENAVSNGAQVFLGEPVTGIDVADEGVYVYTGGGGAMTASLVVHTAAPRADEVARMAGANSFTLTPPKTHTILHQKLQPIPPHI